LQELWPECARPTRIVIFAPPRVPRNASRAPKRRPRVREKTKRAAKGGIKAEAPQARGKAEAALQDEAPSRELLQRRYTGAYRG
jgi:hypothetical protein